MWKPRRAIVVGRRAAVFESIYDPRQYHIHIKEECHNSRTFYDDAVTVAYELRCVVLCLRDDVLSFEGASEHNRAGPYAKSRPGPLRPESFRFIRRPTAPLN